MKYRKKGFTLIEMLVVIGIALTLLVIMLVNLSDSRKKARDNVRVADISTIRLALEEYRVACGVFPTRLDITANNGRTGICSSMLGDFISEIPTAPSRRGDSLLVGTNVIPDDAIFNGYFYAGLSTSLNNSPCYEYHIAAELEFAVNNGENASAYLSEDHDVLRNTAPYVERCGGSARDIGNVNLPHSDDNGFYDFRSVDIN